MNPQIGIKPENTAQVSRILNTILADEFVLYIQTRKAHWNVEGDSFYYFHEFFEEQFTQIDQIADDVAERIRTIGHYAAATLKEYLELTQLTEKSNQKNDGPGHLRDLLNSHESIIINIRKHIEEITEVFHDSGTSDFITNVMERHEKMAWMIRSHVR